MREVKRQVENALIVTAREFGKMRQGKRVVVLFNGIFVEIAAIGLVNQQSYQRVYTIIVSVKYASS